MKALLPALFFGLGLASSAAAHGPHETFAVGAPGDPAKAARTVDVTIRDTAGAMRFETVPIRAAPGEQVRFVVKNDGKAAHEFRLDSVAGNAAHKAMMAQMPGMVHHDANAISLAPGARAELVWRFSKPGTYEYACLIPGHYEAGMHGEIVVGK